MNQTNHEPSPQAEIAPTQAPQQTPAAERPEGTLALKFRSNIRAGRPPQGGRSH